MRKAILVCLILNLSMIFVSSVCRADVSRSGVLFLRIAAGARAAGMGEAFVAISDDATATHWNPAGLGNYPLTSNWLEYPLPSQFELKSIALLRNDIPELNYKRYDVWTISDLDLFRLHRSNWLNYEEYLTSSGESLESIIRKYTQVTDDERIKKMKEITALFNYPVSKDSLMVLKEKILKWTTQTGGEISSLWDQLLEAWDNCLLTPDGLLSWVNQVDNFLMDDSLSSEELSQISSSLPKIIMRRLLETVKIPYRTLFTDSLTACGSDGKLLWIGSKDGLFSFDGKRWRKYSTADGLPSEHVTAILPLSERYVWVGTDQGTAKFDGSKWTPVPLENETIDLQVVDFTHKGEKHIWAATKSKIFRLEGESWQPYDKYAFKIGDTLEKVVRKFVGDENEKTFLKRKRLLFVLDEGVSAAQGK